MKYRKCGGEGKRQGIEMVQLASLALLRSELEFGPTGPHHFKPILHLCRYRHRSSYLPLRIRQEFTTKEG